MYGAFTAGVLSGWTASGMRPEFDVVTGISTGALIAPFAFVGKDFDEELKQYYTNVRSDDIYRRLPLAAWLWSDSVASSEPLAKKIAAGASPEMLNRIIAAHRAGRRLYVGTTNCDTRKLTVWDMGAIASRSTQQSGDLFQKIMLAACSVPGLLPPVPIEVEVDGKRYTELHADGSVNASVFVQPAMLGVAESGELMPRQHSMCVHVIVAGKLYAEPEPAKRGLVHLAGGSLDNVLRSRMEGDLVCVFLSAKYAGADFRLAAVPSDYHLSANMMSFDAVQMRRLFDEGYRCGRNGSAWQPLPPGLDRFRNSPRGDNRFVVLRDTPPPASVSRRVPMGVDAGVSFDGTPTAVASSRGSSEAGVAK
jgi:predicted acylesterase/phospholipase RssA